MNILWDWFRNLTSEDLGRWVRIAAQWLAGSGFAVGTINGDKWTTIGSIIVSIISFIWTLKANTVASKAHEVNKSDEVVVKPTATATPAVVEAVKP
jgi:hypothetical protein